tara:strand:- start:67 stop:375 length:309 start_codon:yes stop_codon:yes gene_type:complete
MAKTNKKPTGRPKGSKNKLSSENKELILKVVNGYFDSETLADDVSMITPKERLDVMSKLHSLTAPKETQADVTVSSEINPQFISQSMIDDLLELDAKTEDDE